MSFIPTIGTRGLYKLLPPFDAQLLPDVTYTCNGVRAIADIIASGVDPIETYYKSVGLTEAEYQTDLANGACIISLQADIGQVITVPSSYIAGFPDIGGIPYTSMILAINLGPIPDSMDLTYLKDKVKSMVVENVGIISTVEVVAASLPMVIGNGLHETTEAARQSNITNTMTDYAKYLDASTKLNAAYEKIRELEHFIIQKHIAP